VRTIVKEIINIPSYPLLYDLHHATHLEDLPLWLSLAEQFGDPLLELGCGTGRVLLPLARAGHRTVGLDRDPAMLAYLLRFKDLPTHSHVFCADMTAYRLDLLFALALLPCNTYSTLTASERVKTLRLARAHLQPGGLFVASLANPMLLEKVPATGETEVEQVFFYPQSGHPIQVSSAWQRSTDIFIVIWYYDHLYPDGRVERLTLRQEHHLASLEKYQAEIEGCGFTSLTTLGDFDRSPYNVRSPHLILLAATR
jgi:SAM-dependent methyltransferase